MYLVIIFIFYFILISVLYTYLYIYLYPYIYSNFIIFIIIYYVISHYFIIINIYINLFDTDHQFFRIINDINPQGTVLIATSIFIHFFIYSDWFSKIAIKKETVQQLIKLHNPGFSNRANTLRAFSKKERSISIFDKFLPNLKKIILLNRVLTPLEALFRDFRRIFFPYGLISIPASLINFSLFLRADYQKHPLAQWFINKFKENFYV